MPPELFTLGPPTGSPCSLQGQILKLPTVDKVPYCRYTNLLKHRTGYQTNLMERGPGTHSSN